MFPRREGSQYSLDTISQGLGNLPKHRPTATWKAGRTPLVAHRFEKTVQDIMVNDGKPQGIAEAFVHRQPGMLVTESMAGTQMIAPGRAVHILIKLVIQITLHALVFQPTNRTARFAARF